MKLIIMTCALTTGYPLPCKDVVAGLKEYLLIEHENVEGVTAATGVITAFTLATSKKFYSYKLPNDNKDYFTENIQISENGTVHYEIEAQITLRKMQATSRNEIRLLAQNRLGVVAKDRNGKYWYLGEANSMEMVSSTSGSGSGLGEFNGYVLKFKGMEELPAQEVNIADWSAITN